MYLLDKETHIVIPADLKQTFENKFILNIGKNEIIKMKNSNMLTDRDLKIAKFLFELKFATAQQLHRFLKEETTLTSLKNRLDKLVKYRVLNKFMLSDFEEDVVAPDAYQVYCLDLGGRYLLAHYSNEDTSDWYSTVNMKASELVGKSLFVTEFYLRVFETCPNKLTSFKVDPEYRVNKKNVFPAFEMQMLVNGQPKYFIGEAVREYDFPVQFREKAFKLESLLATNHWKKYYYDTDKAPVLFVLTDHDQSALDAGKMLSEMTELKDFRLSTDERLQKPLDQAGAFLKYSSEKQALQQTKATTFTP